MTPLEQSLAESVQTESSLMMVVDPQTESNTPCCEPVQPLTVDQEEIDNLSATFKAIGNPVRLQIAMILSQQGREVCVCDIESHFELSQPTISHHLRVLRQAGLIDSEQRGTWIYYFVRPEGVARLQGLLAQLV